jgi:GntR family transcriptional regulator
MIRLRASQPPRTYDVIDEVVLNAQLRGDLLHAGQTGPDDAINPYADEPLYVQLAGIVRRMIQSGTPQHLDPVPSESSLVQRYGVSRDTVRRTIALLRDEGAVFTVPHRGTYVGLRPE